MSYARVTLTARPRPEPRFSQDSGCEASAGFPEDSKKILAGAVVTQADRRRDGRRGKKKKIIWQQKTRNFPRKHFGCGDWLLIGRFCARG